MPKVSPMDSSAPEIELRAYSAEHLLALLESEETFHRSFGLRAASGLRDFYFSGEVSPKWLEQLRTASGADPWTYGFAVVVPTVGQVIGSAGFKGPPDAAGMVEVAYAIVPVWQGKGCATAALGKLIAFASADDQVRVLRAHTLPENNASTRVLAKIGFTKLGEVVDPEDGRVWRWERSPGTNVKPGLTAIRVVLPFHLKNLARVADSEVTLEVASPVTVKAVLEAIEAKYPVLRGTIRDHGTMKRRPFIRFFACKEDLSLEPPDARLPEAVVKGEEPFLVVGAMAGG
jgi:RimJ/RimL family protein N-acetyltransferase